MNKINDNKKLENDWESVYNKYDKKYNYIPKLIKQVKEERINNPENYTKEKLIEMSKKSQIDIENGEIKGFFLENREKIDNE